MCFSLLWVAHLAVLLVVIVGCVLIIRLLLPLLLGFLGAIFARIVEILIWMVASIMAIWIIYDLLSCALGSVRVW